MPERRPRRDFRVQREHRLHRLSRVADRGRRRAPGSRDVPVGSQQRDEHAALEPPPARATTRQAVSGVVVRSSRGYPKLTSHGCAKEQIAHLCAPSGHTHRCVPLTPSLCVDLRTLAQVELSQTCIKHTRGLSVVTQTGSSDRVVTQTGSSRPVSAHSRTHYD